MHSKFISLFFALALVPALAGAQSASPVPPAPAQPSPVTATPAAQPAPMTPDQMRMHMQIFRQFHDQMMHLHESARIAILHSLTPAHRALLARVVGNLAVALHPDPHAAAQQLDAALSATEKHYILNEGRYLMDQMHILMARMRSQMMSTMTNQQRQGMMTMHAGAMGMQGGMMGGSRHETPDAGEILLHIATNQHPDMMMHVMMMHHPH